VSEELEFYLKAGKIASKTLDYARDIIHEGMPLIELCDSLETYIKNSGGELAFPCNISINEIAAHDTADINDKRVIPKNAIVKVDVGVHIQGYIADTATTIAFDDKMNKLVEATRKALMNAIENIKPGITTNKIGKIVDSTAKQYGFQTIKNLSGHMIKRNLLHAGKSVPNYDDGLEIKMEKKEVFAIEPFLTNGKGYVYDSEEIRIFSLKKPPRLKDKELEKELHKIWKERYNLPFCLRWYSKNLETIKKAIEIGLANGDVIGYNVLIEEKKGLVAQEEHTIYINNDGVIIITV